MKISQLFEITVKEDTSPEVDREVGKIPFTDAELKLAYDLVAKKESDHGEIKEFAKKLEDTPEKWQRSANSAYFLLMTMHIMIWGDIPMGAPPSSGERIFTSYPKVENFIVANDPSLTRKDIAANMTKAKEEFKKRPVKVKREDATNLMAAFYKANKDKLRSSVRDAREDLISSIMDGMKVEDAFEPFMK